MIIGVCGYTDKRPIIYPLLKLLQSTGDVVLISNNRHYKRLLEDKSNLGHMSNILISISDSSPDEIFEEIGYDSDDFDHIIFDIQESLPDYVDLMLYVKSFEPDEEELSFLDLIDKYETVKITFDRQPEKGAINVSPDIGIWETIEIIEHNLVLEPIPSNQLTNGLSKLMAPELKMPAKSVKKLLNKRWKL
ncbi:hypothetical protein [Cytobacillus sp. IB215316]|uniref:hypothetical protein n=1 Tax=Cytobacillus sp. IB215316 TaxID=3097354 RepID=UPI002A143902|nr:hypothetical protein [Cytobacillus sp. IB215316]MDX8360761.1 hypothetical protein [Cytobacillus sp. IB215316]